MQIAGTRAHTSVNGPGVRFCVFFQGCPHHCPGCQNPGTWRPKGGFVRDVPDILKMIQNAKYLDGVTLSGGEPFYQWYDCLLLANGIKKMELNLWVYTGYTYEQLVEDVRMRPILSFVDVLVDGPYQQDLPPAKWRGSSNQRLIDVPASLKQGSVVTLDTA